MNSARRPRLLWPLLLVGLGVMLLLQNFNLLPPGTWQALTQLWPVLLILIGLDMLVGRRSWGGAVLVLLLGALLVAAALTWAALRANAQPSGEPQAIIQTVGEARESEVNLDFGVGELNVFALTDSAYLMEGRLQHGPGESLKQSYSVEDGVGTLTLDQVQNTILLPFLAGPGARTHWEVRLTDDMPLSLGVDTGVGEAALDLSGLQLKALNLDTGVGKTTVIFPDSGTIRATISTGVGEVILAIPEDLPARLTVDSGLTTVNFPSRFARNGEVYTTAEFTTNGNYLDLELDTGVGSVTIK